MKGGFSIVPVAIVLLLIGCGGPDLADVHIAVPSAETAGAELFSRRYVSAEHGGVTELVAVDVDQDGDLDIITSKSSETILFSAQGGGRFEQRRLFDGGAYDGRLAVADFNADGSPELLLLERGNLSRYDFGDPSAQPERLGSISSGANDFYVVDWEGDGDLDVLVGDSAATRLWRNDGTGGLAGEDLSESILTGAENVVVDIDRDGAVEIVAIAGDGTVYKIDRGADGAFERTAIGQIGEPDGYRATVVGDFDGDGWPDIVVPDDDSSQLVLLKRAKEFEAEPIGEYQRIERLSVVDWDGDGDADLLGYDDRQGSIVVWENADDGFSQRALLDDQGINAVVPADVDRDGIMDLLSADRYGTGVVWHRHLPPGDYPSWGFDDRSALVNLRASSHLSDDAIADRYAVDKAFDGDPRTSWVEGVEGDGVGEWIDLVIEPPARIDALELMPGYFDQAFWEANNRVSQILLSVTDELGQESTLSFDLDDSMTIQTLPLGDRRVWKLKLEVAAVSAGSRWQDTPIAEVGLLRSGSRVPITSLPPSSIPEPWQVAFEQGPIDFAFGLPGGQTSSRGLTFWRDGVFRLLREESDGTSERAVGRWEYSAETDLVRLTALMRTGRRGEGGLAERSPGDPGGAMSPRGHNRYVEYISWSPGYATLDLDAGSVPQGGWPTVEFAEP